jgi:rubrerythrin
MAHITTCEEVCVMAMEMEQVGRDFYAALSGGSDDQKVRTFCALTSIEESKHYEVFRQMRDDFAQAGHLHTVTPQTQEELRKLVSERVQPSVAAVQKVALGGSLADALEMAMQMERDSILFYQALADRLPGVAKALGQIIKEEAKHLSTLRILAGQE